MTAVKKITAVLAVLAIMLSLASCKKEPQKNDAVAVATTTTTSKKTTTSTTRSTTTAKSSTTTQTQSSTTTQKPSASTPANTTSATIGSTAAPSQNTTVQQAPTTATPVVTTAPPIVTQQPSATVTRPATNATHTALSSSAYYQYNTLSQGEKDIYNTIVAAISNLQSQIDLSQKHVTHDQATAIFRKVLSDHPQFFYVSKKTSSVYSLDTNMVTTFFVYFTDGVNLDKIDANYNVIQNANRHTIQSQIQAFNNKVNQITQTIPSHATELEKEKLIHDYIIKNLAYDYTTAGNGNFSDDNASHTFSAYGALCKGVSLCEGYVKAFQYLCYRVGINATQISGISNGGGHMWNAVKISGAWYQIDLTWNDTASEQYPYYQYFNLTAAQMSADHTENQNGISTPTCNTTTHSFDNAYALNVTNTNQTADNYKTVIDRIIKDDAEYLIIRNNAGGINDAYLTTFIHSQSSAIQQYIALNGYGIVFAPSYVTLNNYTYIKIV